MSTVDTVYKVKDKSISPDAIKMQMVEMVWGMAGQIICNAMMRYNTAVVSLPCHSALFTSSVFLNMINRRINTVDSLIIIITSGIHI